MASNGSIPQCADQIAGAVNYGGDADPVCLDTIDDAVILNDDLADLFALTQFGHAPAEIRKVTQLG